MTCKGVYASLGFNVYITKDDLHTLLTTSTVTGKAYIGKQLIGTEVTVSLGYASGIHDLQKAYFQDKQAIETAKASMASGFFTSTNPKDKP